MNKRERTGAAAYEGIDGRHSPEYDQTASCTPTFTTESRAGVRLNGIPTRILAEHAGTLTRAQYMEWRYGEVEA